MNNELRRLREIINRTRELGVRVDIEFKRLHEIINRIRKLEVKIEAMNQCEITRLVLAELEAEKTKPKSLR